MKKYIAIILVLVISVSTVLSGCSGQQKNKDNENNKNSTNKTTIRFATFYSDKDLGPIYKEIVQAYEKANPGTKIDILTDYDDQKIKDSLSQKGDLDIVGIRRDQVIDFAKSGFITDISDFADQNNLSRKLYKISLAYGKFNGKIYGIGDMPMTVEWFYNVDMFDKYGLKEPTDLRELQNVCTKLKSKKIIPIGVGAMDGWTLTMLFGMITAQTTGADPFTTSYGSDAKTYAKIPGINDAFNIYGKLAGACIPSNSTDANFKQSVDDFVKGKSAILPALASTEEMIEQMKPSGFNYQVFDTPVKFVDQPISRYSASAGQVIAVPSNTKNKDEVYKFLEFLLSDEAQKLVTEKGYISPVISSNNGEGKVRSRILAHVEAAEDNSIMLIDNLEPNVGENTTRILQDILEGRVRPSEGWSRILKITFQQQ